MRHFFFSTRTGTRPKWQPASWCVSVIARVALSAVSALAQTSVTASPAKASEDVAGIREAAERFLRALDDLDWEPFSASWASEPTPAFAAVSRDGVRLLLS